jgi:murein DD-endopeptidase MepM/ murein hydrolase activator NlpD
VPYPEDGDTRPGEPQGAGGDLPDHGRTPSPRGSIPDAEVLLDPPSTDGCDHEQAGSPDTGPRNAEPSPGRPAVIGTALGLMLIGGLCGTMIWLSPPKTASRRGATPRQQPITAPAVSVASPRASASAAPSAAASAGPPAAVLGSGPPVVGPWRIAQITPSPEIKIVEGVVDRRMLLDALTSNGIPKAQVYRILGAFEGIRRFDQTRKRDTFAVATDIATRRVRAFEYQVSPTEIYQARERQDGALIGERLDLHVEKKLVSGSIAVGEDLSASAQASGFDPSLLVHLDDAFEGRAQLSSLRAGARLRVVAQVETALGAFARYTELSAIEYHPADPDAPSSRIYRFDGTSSHGYFDAKGQQPYKGGFRVPIPFARVTSRFSMKRMHPILHVVRPHLGVDYAAPSGTPVYAASFGTIEWVGNAGASGNLVTIRHAAGLSTGYAHLSRFAPHLEVGQRVDARQLIGYVGSTGRSTGPHLHFSAKKSGVFIDPLSLKLDGIRVLPKNDRGEFDQKRDELDRLLEAIPLPPGPAAVAETKEPEDSEPLGEEDHP